MRLEQFLTPESLAIALAAFYEEVVSALRVPEADNARALEVEYRRRDGSTFWIESKFSFFRDADGQPTGVFGVGRDITKRRRVELALHESEERYRELMDDMLEGCQIIGFDWRYLYVNHTVTVQGKQTRAALVGRTMMEAYPGIEDTTLFVELRRCMNERVARKMENEFHFPDGSKGWFELSIQPAPEGIFILSIDITERKRAEEALRSSYAQIEKQMQRLAAMHAIDLAISGNVDLRLTIEILLSHVTAQLGVDAADVLLLRPGSRVLEFAAGRGFRGTGISHSRVRVGEGNAGNAVLDYRHIQVTRVEGTESSFSRANLIVGEGFVIQYVVPLAAKGQVKGVLEIFHRSLLQPDADWLSFLESLGSQAAIAIDNAQLYEGLERSNFELALAYDATIEGWSRALDLRDRETEGHTQRVTELTLRLARFAGLTEQELVQVRRGALLHDMGKMGIPDAILFKSDTLSAEDWELMRCHPQFAFDMLSPIAYLRPALDIPYCHHENWDGSGYPRGLRGEQIPFAARLFKVVDIWDALRSDRPYRKAWSGEQALTYIRSIVGTQLDPQAVELFLHAPKEADE